MATNNMFVPSIDYTSRDYASILSDMTNLIPNFSPNWTSRDPADFGMTMLELFSYMGDILNYYIDVSANEAFITSAVQTQSVLNIAALLGYFPTQPTAASVVVTFTNSTSSPISLPALTQVATSLVANATTAQIIFETNNAITVPANGTYSVTATQGQTVTNEVVASNTQGTPYQGYQLAQYPVINNSISIVINGALYNQVQYLIDSSGFDPVYTATTNAEQLTSIQFGDGVSGRIPPSGSPIYATYRIGGGVVGNVSQNTINYIVAVPSMSSIPAGLSVTNSSGQATGGGDAESVDSVRVNAPLSIRSINRAVSLLDYAYLSTQVNGVSKAIATANVYSSVTIYICPNGDPGVLTDNLTPSAVFTEITPNVLNYLVDKAPANTSVTFQPPTYVGTYLNINLTIAPQYSQFTTTAAVTNALNSLFDISNVVFGDTITVSDVHTAISTVNGVLSQQITKMVRADQDQTFTITNKSLTSNVATLTVSGTNTITVGQTISVSGVDSTFNGTYVVTSSTSSTFSYSLVATNISSTSASGNVTVLTVKDIVCATNEIPTISALSGSSTGVGLILLTPTGGI